MAKEATIYVAEPFLHNLALVSVLYISERPEMTSHDEEPNKAKTTKGKIESTKGEKMKLKKQIAVIVLALTATTSPVWSQDRQALPSRTAQTLQGTWRVIKHGVNCQTGEELSSFPALVTFNQDGTLHGDFVGPGGTAAESTAEHGVWSRQGPDYSFRSVSYGWDPNTGAFEGRAEFTAIVQLTSVNTFTYNISVCNYDADGNQLFCGCGRAEGTRFE